MPELTSIGGVGDAIAAELRDAGYETPADVRDASVEELADVHLIGETTAADILDESQEDDAARGGRPSLLDEYEDKILQAASRGLTYEGIARVAGVGVSTLNDWRDEYDEFSEALERARASAEQELIREADAEFVLERSYGYTKEQEVELSGEVDTTGLSAEEKERLDDLFNRDPQPDE